LPGACMQRLGVQQQAVQVKQAGVRWVSELVQRQPLCLQWLLVALATAMVLFSACSLDNTDALTGLLTAVPAPELNGGNGWFQPSGHPSVRSDAAAASRSVPATA